MDKNIEGDEYLHYPGKKIRAKTKFQSGFIERFACLKGRTPTVDEEFDCRQEAHNREDRFGVAIYGDTQSSTCTNSAGHLPHKFSHVSFVYNHWYKKKTEIRHNQCPLKQNVSA